MRKQAQHWLAIFLVIATSLACQTLFPTPNQQSNPVETGPASHPTAISTAELNPTPNPVHFSIFEELWQIVDQEYLYPDFNGLDWDAIYDEYLQRIEDGMSDQEFYLAMDEMIYRLGDDHSVFLSPEEVAEEDSLYAGEYEYIGLGMMLSAIPERQRAVVLFTFKDSPAEQAGLQPRDSILLVDDQPVLDEYGAIRESLRGEEGTQVNLTVQTPGQDPRQFTLTQSRIYGRTSVPYAILTSPGGKRIGYILLTTFSDSTVDDQVTDILGEMTDDGIDALVIDNRLNEGGADTVLEGVLSLFTQGTVGYFVNRDGREALRIKAHPKFGTQDLPLVVLVGPDTVSFGEIFAGILQDLQRAYLIGETTEGNIETLWGYDFEGGSRAWIAHDTFRPINNPDIDWEKTGIRPDQTIPVNWDEYTLEDDPAVQAALKYFDFHSKQ
jgi:carboxyl-terminal processing protease